MASHSSSQKNSAFQHQAKKRFGQNFLNNIDIIERIVRNIAPTAKDNLVEIGPGQGAITGPLLSLCPKLNVIEIDKHLIPISKDFETKCFYLKLKGDFYRYIAEF